MGDAPRQRVVSRDEWLAARRELLAKEKELTRQRDAVARERRALDALNPAYQHLDLVPKGRDEDALPYPMSWLRHHDAYDD